MYILSLNMWFQKLIIQFFFSIDRIVFGFISDIYDVMITVARTSPLSQADILDMAGRIYKLLAIFMIFKVTFSLIMYVVNPDDFSDKSKGLSKLISNIIISLSMLILTPYIFNYAYQLQTIILEDNSLGALIFGEKNRKDFLNSAGDSIAFTAMSPFFAPNSSINLLSECNNVIDHSDTTNSSYSKLNQTCFGINDSLEPISNDKNSLYYLTTSAARSDHTIENFDEIDLKNYATGIQHNNLGLMFRQKIALATIDGQFIINYRYIFSTVLGVIIVILLLTFCLDIGLRSIKLAFLQLVAPIPILSYVDPKSGKDGMFKKWCDMCFKTYLSLFIRILAIYFAIYIISLVSDNRLVDMVDGTYQTDTFVTILIIIGALMFAKQFPKILEGLGVKLDGDGKFTLNPLKKLEDSALGGKQMSKLTKGVGTAVGGAALAGGASLLTGKGLRGTATAMKKAVTGGMKGEKFGKNFSNSYAAAEARKKQVAEMKANGVTPWQVSKENFLNKFRDMDTATRKKLTSSRLENISKGYNDIRSTAIGVDDVSKAQNNLIKGIESAGSSAFKYGENAKLSNGKTLKDIGIDSSKMTSSQIYQEVLKAENGILDARINELTHDPSKWVGNAAGIANAKVKVQNIVSTMQTQIDEVNAVLPENIQKIKNVLNADGTVTSDVKSSGKGAEGAKGAYETSGEYLQAQEVAKYTTKPKGS